jgi:cystathionine beta-lyase/cystathionine gamma-synthase
MKESGRSGFDTQSVHAGEARPFIDRAIVMPIFQSSTFEYWGEKSYNDVRYIRLNNTPNHIALGKKLSAMEGTETAVVTASGMAAISTALLALVGEGGHLIAQDNLYGGSYHFLHEDYPNLGRKVSFFNPDRIEELGKLLKPNTKAIYVESISNPLLKVPDLKAIAAFAKEKGLLTLIDNTFPSPFNFNPTHIGYDVVLHSATKYLNGHSDIVAGAIATSNDLMKRIVPLLNHLGGSLDPHPCFLLQRGMKTLGIRMRWHNDSAKMIATALENHPNISRVLYPGLKSHPDHARANELFRGFGGMISFEHKADNNELDERMKKLKFCALAPSLGGVETLITRPATTSHSGIPKAEREKLGVGDNLVRLSVGLENPEDLISDIFENL